jgi:hypothetical protein
MDVSLDLAALLAALAWPVVLGYGLWRYRKPIETFLTKQPVKSFSVAGVLSMDFGEPKEMAPRSSGQDIVVDLCQPTPSGAVTDAMRPGVRRTTEREHPRGLRRDRPGHRRGVADLSIVHTRAPPSKDAGSQIFRVRRDDPGSATTLRWIGGAGQGSVGAC